jgi:hypothetical protein
MPPRPRPPPMLPQSAPLLWLKPRIIATMTITWVKTWTKTSLGQATPSYEIEAGEQATGGVY